MSKPDYSEDTRLDYFATLEESADELIDWERAYLDPNYAEIESELRASDNYHATRIRQEGEEKPR